MKVLRQILILGAPMVFGIGCGLIDFDGKTKDRLSDGSGADGAGSSADAFENANDDGNLFPGAGEDGLPDMGEDASTICYYPNTTASKDKPGPKPGPKDPKGVPTLPTDFGVAATVTSAPATLNGVEVVHTRIIFNPKFVDNTYGVNSIGWTAEKKGHTLQMLYHSDHVVVRFGDNVEVKLDYLSEKTPAPSTYSNLGVSGGEGSMLKGNAADVVKTMTSIDLNLNERGYSSYLGDSPATDDKYTVNPAAPKWDYRVIYEVWIKKSAVGDAKPTIDSVHASPSKLGESTLPVAPKECPTP